MRYTMFGLAAFMLWSGLVFAQTTVSMPSPGYTVERLPFSVAAPALTVYQRLTGFLGRKTEPAPRMTGDELRVGLSGRSFGSAEGEFLEWSGTGVTVPVVIKNKENVSTSFSVVGDFYDREGRLIGKGVGQNVLLSGGASRVLRFRASESLVARSGGKLLFKVKAVPLSGRAVNIEAVLQSGLNVLPRIFFSPRFEEKIDLSRNPESVDDFSHPVLGFQSGIRSVLTNEFRDFLKFLADTLPSGGVGSWEKDELGVSISVVEVPKNSLYRRANNRDPLYRKGQRMLVLEGKGEEPGYAGSRVPASAILAIPLKDEKDGGPTAEEIKSLTDDLARVLKSRKNLDASSYEDLLKKLADMKEPAGYTLAGNNLKGSSAGFNRLLNLLQATFSSDLKKQTEVIVNGYDIKD